MVDMTFNLVENDVAKKEWLIAAAAFMLYGRDFIASLSMINVTANVDAPRGYTISSLHGATAIILASYRELLFVSHTLFS